VAEAINGVPLPPPFPGLAFDIGGAIATRKGDAGAWFPASVARRVHLWAALRLVRNLGSCAPARSSGRLLPSAGLQLLACWCDA
jgi:hypothetical protein